MRTLFPYLATAGFAAVVLWAVSFGAIEPADFTFCNGTEIKSIDPAIVTGQPEGRIIRCLFEGLVNWHPKTLKPLPGVAENIVYLEDEQRWECISEDGLTYTFRLRPDALWSNGRPMTADDFVYSFRRFLDPGTTQSQYVGLLYYVVNAEKYYSAGKLAAGDPVEVELQEEPNELPGARGRLLRGKLVHVDRHVVKKKNRITGKIEDEETRTYTVKIDGKRRRFRVDAESESGLEDCAQVLLDFEQVGIRALDDRTLQIKLVNRTPYFLNLMGFYPLFPVNRECIEQHGFPAWTKPGVVVGNGPFLLKSRRIRDRIRMVKNPRYWNHKEVYFDVVDALAVESYLTMFNMYEAGQVDWIPRPPSSIVDELLRQRREDFQPEPILNTYFYRFNVTRGPLQDKRVRQALALAVDTREIVETVTKAGEIPARSLVPPGIAGYEPALRPKRDVARAKQLLAEAGYPNGQGLGDLEIEYNTSDDHKIVAELIERQWRTHLGVNIRLRNQEWQAHLATVRQLDYEISRAGWIGDYSDPNTFLDMFITGGANNQTGWGSAEYDRLIAAAASEPDPRRRMQHMHDAEAILMDEMPILPLFYRVSLNMVRPYVNGFFENIQDVHPLQGMSIDLEKKRAYRQAKGLR